MRRLKKNKNLLLVLKMVLAFYLAVFTASYLTSNTSAYFSEHKEINGTLTAGTWKEEDKSALTFLGNGNQNIKSCPATVTVEIKNIGEGDMLSDGTYEVYHVDNGNPEKHGKKLELPKGEGIIKALESGQIAKLTFETSIPGTYAFAVYQPSDMNVIWSKDVKVSCDSSIGPKSSGTDNEQSDEGDEDTEGANIENTGNNDGTELEDGEVKEDSAGSEIKQNNKDEENNEAESEATISQTSSEVDGDEN